MVVFCFNDFAVALMIKGACSIVSMIFAAALLTKGGCSIVN